MQSPDLENLPSRIGSSITLERLSADAENILAQLRAEEPVSYVPSINMVFITRYADIEAVLGDAENFVVGSGSSVLRKTFGSHMLTVDGPDQVRFKMPFRPVFMPKPVRENLGEPVAARVDNLIGQFANAGSGDLRKLIASRLPILVMLDLFGLPDSHEPDLRRWFNTFEAALANFSEDEAVQQRAAVSAAEFGNLLKASIDAAKASGSEPSLLNTLVQVPEGARLSDTEIIHNAFIVFFGGISTVEALILNTCYALSRHPQILDRVRSNRDLISPLIEETVRWLSPVQSATRHTPHPTDIGGVSLPAGVTVNCMLGSANRDADIFTDPESFDIDRPDIRRHMAFAVGPHHCLGSHLARMEGAITLDRLLSRLPNLSFDPENKTIPKGHEFRQPASMPITWIT